jgi:hypothetical protein
VRAFHFDGEWGADASNIIRTYDELWHDCQAKSTRPVSHSCSPRLGGPLREMTLAGVAAVDSVFGSRREQVAN